MSVGIQTLESLLPHRPPMVFIDRLLRRDAQSAAAVKTFAAGDYALADGAVVEAALIECVAQTAAAIGSAETENNLESAGIGMLVSVDEFVFHGRVLEGETVEVTAEVTRRLTPFCFVSGTVKCGGRMIAEGTLKVIGPG